MPSTYESWGRTAVEAMASGIPVIAAPTPGLVEALTSPTLGECGLFADADDDDGWIAALKLLDSPKEWDRYSALARQRSAELAAIGDVQMGELVGKLTKLATGESIR
jgi:glycosyltransferase involved in cell wall biosynthesis